ncbi:MAG: class I SAM-dependent methyltransferase [Acholeplasmataceae bacterium]|nr:class I SAM-dependent methyltransferase [Acholeplasmataceae bacterium]
MYDLLSEYYDNLFTFNPKLKDFVFPFVTKGQQALELGSGTGRLTHLIGQLGMDSIGIDLDQKMTSIASTKYPNQSFITDDILDYLDQTNQKFDLMTCFGNTIAHLDSQSIDHLFRQIKLHLNKNKYFIIQLLNYTKILSQKPDSLPDLVFNNLVLKRNYTYLKDEILFETILFKDDDIFELGKQRLYPYTHMALIDKALQHGFESSFYGKPDFSPYQLNDSHVYIVLKNI